MGDEFYYVTIGYTISWHESAKYRRYLVMLHPLPTLDVATVPKSQRQTGDNLVFTWCLCFENTVTSCELHATSMFGTNGGVGESQTMRLSGLHVPHTWSYHATALPDLSDNITKMAIVAYFASFYFYHLISCLQKNLHRNTSIDFRKKQSGLHRSTTAIACLINLRFWLIMICVV